MTTAQFFPFFLQINPFFSLAPGWDFVPSPGFAGETVNDSMDELLAAAEAVTKQFLTFWQHYTWTEVHRLGNAKALVALVAPAKHIASYNSYNFNITLI